MGGMNTWTPIRPFVPTYYDSLLLSDDINKIREHYGLKCVDKSKFTSRCKDIVILEKLCNKMLRVFFQNSLSEIITFLFSLLFMKGFLTIF